MKCFLITEEEKNRILEMHKCATSKSYLKENMISEADQAQVKSTIERIKTKPTPQEQKVKQGVIECIKNGNYPHLGPLVAMGGSCIFGIVALITTAFTGGLSAPIAAIYLAGCGSSITMGFGDFWKGASKEIDDIKKCIGM